MFSNTSHKVQVYVFCSHDDYGRGDNYSCQRLNIYTEAMHDLLYADIRNTPPFRGSHHL